MAPDVGTRHHCNQHTRLVLEQVSFQLTPDPSVKGGAVYCTYVAASRVWLIDGVELTASSVRLQRARQNRHNDQRNAEQPPGKTRHRVRLRHRTYQFHIRQ